VLPVRRLAKNGLDAWAEVIAHDYEGTVAKEETSLYEAGPTRRWLKSEAARVYQRRGPLAAADQHSTDRSVLGQRVAAVGSRASRAGRRAYVNRATGMAVSSRAEKLSRPELRA